MFFTHQLDELLHFRCIPLNFHFFPDFYFVFLVFFLFALPTLINFSIFSTGFHIYFHPFFCVSCKKGFQRVVREERGGERVINGLVGKATVNLCWLIYLPYRKCFTFLLILSLSTWLFLSVWVKREGQGRERDVLNWYGVNWNWNRQPSCPVYIDWQS